MNGRGFDPENFFGPNGPFGPRGPLGPSGIFGPQGPFGTGAFAGGGWTGDRGRGGGSGDWPGRGPDQRYGERHGERHRRRARRGDVRNAILQLLTREPMNGYQLMQEIAEGTDGAWQPSSGAIYPALAQLEDEGLITQTLIEGRKAYQLTDAGRAAAESGQPLTWGSGSEPENPWAEDGQAPDGEHEQLHRGGQQGRGGPGGRHGHRGRHGQDHSEDARGSWDASGLGALWKGVGGTAVAAQAVSQTGDSELMARATETLEKTRRRLYRMLAEYEVDAEGDDLDDDLAEEASDAEDGIAEGEIIEE